MGNYVKGESALSGTMDDATGPQGIHTGILKDNQRREVARLGRLREVAMRARAAAVDLDSQ